MPITNPAQVQGVHTAMHYTEITPPGSAAHQEVRRFRAEIFSHAIRSTPQNYLETVDFAPEQTIPIAVRRKHSDLLIGTICLETPPDTLIESVVHFIPDSLPARSLAAGRIAEMGGFAAHPSLERDEILDVLDVLAATILQITEQNVDWFWLLSRRQLMRLLRGEIPHLLPPYHFTLCRDVQRWNEESERLQRLRALRPKGFYVGPHDLPPLYTISWQMLAHDLAQRMTLFEERHHYPHFRPLLNQALRKAHQDTRQELGV